MGQRLVISVVKNDKRVAAVYFHWSAYTLSALTETRDLLNFLLDDENANMDVRLACIRYAEKNGGGIVGGKDSEEFKFIQNLFPSETFKTEHISRNYGIVALSESEMASFDDWSEGDVIIDLDEQIIVNQVFESFSSLEDYNTESAERNDDFVPVSESDVYSNEDINIENINFNDIDDVIDAVENLENYRDVWRNQEGWYCVPIC